MKVKAENFKGINFVRISQLPKVQKELIATTLPPDKIIKILKENEILADCIQYKHYEAWFTQVENKVPEEVKIPLTTSSLNLAID